MDDASESDTSERAGAPDGTARLRGAGVGSVAGGLVLATLALGLAYPLAAGIVLALGVTGWVIARRYSASTSPSIGVGAVGAIGLVEATTDLGLGLSPFALAAVAVGFGLFDIVAGGVLGRYRG